MNTAVFICRRRVPEEMASVSRCRFSLLVLVLSSTVTHSNGELFTAIVDIKDLVYREREMKASFRDYIAMEERRLARIRHFYTKMEESHDLVGEDVGQYLGHPVNSYLLIRRFYKEWPEMESLVQHDNTEGIYIYIRVLITCRDSRAIVIFLFLKGFSKQELRFPLEWLTLLLLT